MGKGKQDLQKLSGEKWENNPRRITETQFKHLKQNLEELGDLSGVVHDLNSNMYTGGNQRSEVFKDAPFVLVETFDPPTKTGTVAVGYILYEGEKYNYRQVRWNNEQCRKAVITANSMGGEFDMDILANHFDDLPLLDWDLNIPDFELAKDLLSDGMAGPEEEEPDLTPPKNPITVLGDFYELNKHRVYCADSTDSEAVAKLMGGKMADMVFTDPPYGENINFSYLGWMTEKKHKNVVINGDELTGEALADFLKSIHSNITLFNKGAYYVCSGWKQLPVFQTCFPHNMVIVWDKEHLGFGMGDYRSQTEFILYCKNGSDFYGDNSQRNIWRVGRVNDNTLHPNIKPVKLILFALNNSSKENNIILDLFLGSHSTLIACEQSNRICYGQENEPKHVDTGIKRWVNYMDENGKPYTINRNGKELNRDEISKYLA